MINFYYYKNVELTANSKTETYDGTEKSVSGYTGAPEGVTFNGISASGSGTDVGEYNVTFAEGTLNTVDTTEKYIVTKATPGKLTIKPAEVTVTIKGNTKTETYDGTEYTVTGYTVESISNNLYKEEYFALKDGAKAEAKGTNAGDYMMGLTKESFENKNTNFKVTFVVEDGKLTITQPSRPTRPSTPTKDVTSVKTADGSQMTLWMSMMLASAAGIVFLGKKRKEEQ